MSWRIRGTYFESCNCDAICPCRRIDGVPGGRSTHGVCMGALSWLIEEGAVDSIDLSGLPVALVSRYSDDEAGSPWTWILYLDARATSEQLAALEAIFAVVSEGTRSATFRGRGRQASSSRCDPWRSTSTTHGVASGCGSATASASGYASAMTAARRSRA